MDKDTRNTRKLLNKKPKKLMFPDVYRLPENDAEASAEVADLFFNDLPTTKKSPRMTREHFNFIAEVVRSLPREFISAQQQSLIASYFSSELANTNDKFDRDRFMKAAAEEYEKT